MWRNPNELRQPVEHERDTIYVALANGEVKLADASAYVETSAEYHSTTGVYLGQTLQDAWSGWIGWEGDMFEHDDAGWHCYRYPNGGDTKVRVAVVGWQPAIKDQPAAPAFAEVAA